MYTVDFEDEGTNGLSRDASMLNQAVESFWRQTLGMCDMIEVLNVQDERVAKVFLDTRRRHLLLNLVSQERPLQELSTIMGMSLNLVHYHVGRLQALGLVEIARREARSGRPIKHYRAVANSFFVPSHLTTHSPGEKLSAELRAALERSRQRRLKDGILYFVDEQRTLRMRRVQEDAIGATECWCILDLIEEDARALGDEMKALLTRYERRSHDSARGYLAYYALTPRLVKERAR